MKKYPVTIKDTDVFLHGTSIKNYQNIQSSGFLKGNVPQRNWGLSNDGVICFEKWGQKNDKAVINAVSRWCHSACVHDGSKEGVILRITGKELKKLNCEIYNDTNMNSKLLRDSEGIPIGVDSTWPYLSIVVECDVPFEYLTLFRKVAIKE